MIEALVSNPMTTMLEQSLNFTEQRHQVLLQNIANVSVPGYLQQDVSVAGFQQAMRDAVDRRRMSFNGRFQPTSNNDVEFDPCSSRVNVIAHDAQDAMPFHDRGVRSIESLMGDLADNATAHNAIAAMLRSKYDGIAKAISMKI
jgi:flagellar basal-body rod protein FlgB